MAGERGLRTNIVTAQFYPRLAAAGVAASLVVLTFAFVVVKPWVPEAPLVNDFISFWTAASLVREGAGSTLFDMGLQQGFQRDLRLQVATLEEVRRQAGFLIPYHNPPALALLFLPLTWLPLYWAYLLWSALSLLATWVAVALPLRSRPRAWTVVLVLLTFAGVADCLLWSQIAGVLLLAVSLGLLALTSGRPVLGGALLGLLWLKPQYAVVFALVFLVKGRRRELAGMVGAGLAVAILSLAMVGFGGILSYLELLNRIGEFNPPADSLVKPYAMINWRALLLALWPGIPDSLGSALMLGLGAATVLASLLAWRGEWNPASPRFPRQMLVAVLATLVASPHSHFHGTVLLLAPLSMALARPMPGAVLSRAWGPMLALGYLLALLIWPVRSVGWLFVPYSLLAVGLLLVQLRAGESRVVAL
ncbi:MAG: DUF2029 domain-containing protein [Chloroflexi bacterium]|nr:DUF2029 domain-containing protein [Chloroflexota bacterium]